MSNEQQEITVDDVWVNRLANKIGILTAQNERLMIEVESLQQQLLQYQQPNPITNGEHEGAIA